MREVVNGLMYILSTGCQWRAIPMDLPPKSSVYDYFDLWTYGGTLERIHQALYEQCREQAQREASPTAAIVIYITSNLCASRAAIQLARRRRSFTRGSYASGGIGSPQHVAGELFKLMAGVEMLHVPFFRNVSLARGTSGCQ